MKIIITQAYEGRLLRSYLKYTLGLSSSVLSRLKANETGIRVNGCRVTVRYVLRAGDELEINDASVLSQTETDTPTDMAQAEETGVPPSFPAYARLCANKDFLLYENGHILVINKPAGMPTHPSHGHLDDSLASALSYYYSSEAASGGGMPFVFRAVGRLDKDTSGAVIIAKNQMAAGYLGTALKTGLTVKRYLAVLDGEMPRDPDVRIIDAPIARPDGRSIVRIADSKDAPDATPAVTLYRVLATGNGHSLVLCEPQTGRTHQLRVHFSHVGYPMCGDVYYGRPSDLISRHALHAVSLSFPCPFDCVRIKDRTPRQTRDSLYAQPDDALLNQVTGEGYLHVFAPLPDDFKSLIQTLFGDCVLPDGTLLFGILSRDSLSCRRLSRLEGDGFCV